MNWRRTLSVMRKEAWHILRDRAAFFLTIFSPVFLLFTMGYAFSVDIKDVAVAVMDGDQTPLSRQYIRGLGATGDVLVRYVAADYADVEGWLMTSEAKAAIIIPPGFGADLRAGREASVQVLVDGTDPNTANVALAHIGGYTQQFAMEVVMEAMNRAGFPMGEAVLRPIDLRIRTWYNPTLKMVIGFIPALIAMVMGMPAVAATSALVREKERGTFEQLIVTPIRRAELLVGKLVPYMISGLISVVLCAVLAVYWFGAPFRGNFPLYLVFSADFFLATMSIALILSTFVKSQQAAQIGAVLIFFFPGFFLSGIFYPLFSMAPIMKMEAFAMPTTHYVFINRGMFLKGQGLAALWPYAAALLVMGVLFLSLAVLLFKKKLT
ncbi:MAG: ABC transporter permease [Anaerolineae bacterium]